MSVSPLFVEGKAPSSLQPQADNSIHLPPEVYCSIRDDEHYNLWWLFSHKHSSGRGGVFWCSQRYIRECAMHDGHHSQGMTMRTKSLWTLAGWVTLNNWLNWLQSMALPFPSTTATPGSGYCVTTEPLTNIRSELSNHSALRATPPYPIADNFRQSKMIQAFHYKKYVSMLSIISITSCCRRDNCLAKSK